MAEVETTSKSALTLLRAGRTQQAARLCNEILKSEPDSAEAHYVVGLVRREERNAAGAAQHLARAVEIAPDHLDARLALANLLLDNGQLDAAVGQYLELLHRDPKRVEAHYHLGLTLQRLNQFADAATCYETALLLKPDFPEAANNFGSVLLALGRPGEAAVQFANAVRLKPAMRSAMTNLLALPWLNEQPAAAAPLLDSVVEAIKPNTDLLVAAARAHAALRDGKDCELMERALKLEPRNAELRRFAGRLALDRGELARAEALLRDAIRQGSARAQTFIELGAAQINQGRAEDALRAFSKAVEIEPGNSFALNNLGYVLRVQGRLEEARQPLERATQVDPAYGDAHNNLALTLLAQGDLVRGWEEYEWRERTSLHRARPFTHPRWRGEPLAGKTILVHAEQGLGDEILFASCLPDLLALGGKVILECDPRLVSLLARSFPGAQVVPRLAYGTAPVHGCEPDFEIPMGGLARLFRSRAEDFRGEAYLHAEPARVEAWRARLAATGPGLKLGFSWRSSLKKGLGRGSYPGLEYWLPLFLEPGVHISNLQFDGTEEFTALRNRCRLAAESWPGLDLKDDMEELAALLVALDGVVTVPTSVSTLAGALGCRVWRIRSPHVKTDPMCLGRAHGYPWYARMAPVRGSEFDSLRLAFAVQQIPRLLAPESGGSPEAAERLFTELIEGETPAATPPDAPPFLAAEAAWRRGEPEAAIALLKPLATQIPESSVIRALLRACLHPAAGRYSEAVALARRLEPSPLVELDLANALFLGREYREAAVQAERLCERFAGWEQPERILGSALLGMGQLTAAWHRSFGCAVTLGGEGMPDWDGSPFPGRCLKVVATGHPFDLLALTCVPELTSLAAQVLFEDRSSGLPDIYLRSLVPPIRVIGTDGGPRPDAVVALAALLPLRRPDLAAFPAEMRLRAKPSRAEAKRAQQALSKTSRLRIGLALRSPAGVFGLFSATLTQLLLEHGATLVALDGGEAAAKFSELAPRMHTHLSRWDPEAAAGLMQSLDVLIAVPGEAMMLAAAVGLPVYWLDLPALGPAAGWHLGTDHCPWFPGVVRIADDASGHHCLRQALQQLTEK